MRRAPAAVDFDCLITGSGVIAMTMATLLHVRKLAGRGRVAVIAARPDPAAAAAAVADGWDLRVFALSRASQRLLEVCGIWQALASDRTFAYERMCVWDARGEPRGDGSLTFDCALLGEPNLGSIVDGRALEEGCRAAAAAAGVVLIDSAAKAVVTQADAVRVRSSDGRELSSRLLIAADGTRSKTRRLLGIDTAGHAYHQDALVAHVSTQRPHDRTAWQRFLPTGPLAFLPLPDGRSSIVWSMPRAQATRLRAQSAAQFGAALSAASGGALGDCELTTPVAAFPLQLQYALQYVRPRAVLLGDAAHVVHPLAGQGLNLGFLDCAALATVLAEADGSSGFGEFRVLRRYERWRRSENLLMATALDGLERLFGNDDPLKSRLRILGLNAVSRAPPLKRMFAERALGLSGDIPGFLTETQPEAPALR
jgi:2-octaprenylphenol hydroxylase